MKVYDYNEFICSCSICNTPFKVNSSRFTACICSYNGIYSADITLNGDITHSKRAIHVDIIPSIEQLKTLLIDLS